MKIEQSMQIATRPEKVWSYLTDPDKIRQWYSTLEAFGFIGEATSGEGATLAIRDGITGKMINVQAKITEWIDNERVAFEMTSGTGARVYSHRWVIETSAYGTHLVWHAHIEPETSVVDMLVGLFRGNTVEDKVKKMLNVLREMVESTRTRSAA